MQRKVDMTEDKKQENSVQPAQAPAPRKPLFLKVDKVQNYDDKDGYMVIGKTCMNLDNVGEFYEMGTVRHREKGLLKTTKVMLKTGGWVRLMVPVDIFEKAMLKCSDMIEIKDE